MKDAFTCMVYNVSIRFVGYGGKCLEVVAGLPNPTSLTAAICLPVHSGKCFDVHGRISDWLQLYKKDSD